MIFMAKTTENKPVIDINDERAIRIKKLQDLQEMGINPYPALSERMQTLREARELPDTTSVSIAGRVMTKRDMGKLAFCHLLDDTGTLQVAFKSDEISKESYDLFAKKIDSGDIIAVQGERFVTHKGEPSVLVKQWQILSKSLLPLPDKFHGLQDEEIRLRKRYLDFIANPELKELFRQKSRFWNSMRQFLLNEGFLEVETPVLETSAGGADARPFVTHHNALDIDVYLRISCGELWQKRLMVAGFDKTFEIGRIFRNEGMSPEHAQDYTQMEFYWSFADYQKGMDLVERMYKHIAQETFGTLQFETKNFSIDLSKKWEMYDFVELIKEKTGVDVFNTDLKEIEATLKKLDVSYDKKGFNWSRGVDTLWKFCRKSIAGPGFLVNVPVEMEPLAKRDEKNPKVVQRYQIILAGSEVGKGYSELNDPIDQAERFGAQQKLRDAGDDEAQMFDQDFVDALEHGMPPTTGFGVSERLFSFLAGKPIRECQLFPLMRPMAEQAEEKDPSTNSG